MKVYLSDINESWIVDRIRAEWYEHNSELSTEKIKLQIQYGSSLHGCGEKYLRNI